MDSRHAHRHAAFFMLIEILDSFRFDFASFELARCAWMPREQRSHPTTTQGCRPVNRPAAEFMSTCQPREHRHCCLRHHGRKEKRKRNTKGGRPDEAYRKDTNQTRGGSLSPRTPPRTRPFNPEMKTWNPDNLDRHEIMHLFREQNVVNREPFINPSSVFFFLTRPKHQPWQVQRTPSKS